MAQETAEDCLSDASEFERHVMQVIVDKALTAHKSDERCGIAAAVIKDGKIIATGENEVNDHPDPTKHAEMVVFAKAAKALGTTDLSDCVLLSTLQPCEMCLSAMRFSGIRRVIFGARQENVAAKYFVFPHLKISDYAADRGEFQYVGGVQELAVVPLYVDGTE